MKKWWQLRTSRTKASLEPLVDVDDLIKYALEFDTICGTYPEHEYEGIAVLSSLLGFMVQDGLLDGLELNAILHLAHEHKMVDHGAPPVHPSITRFGFKSEPVRSVADVLSNLKGIRSDGSSKEVPTGD